MIGNIIQYMLKNKNKNPISFSSPLFIYIYMHGNGKIASVKSAKLTIHLQRTCKRRIIPTLCRSVQKSSSNSETRTTRKLQRGYATKLAKCRHTTQNLILVAKLSGIQSNICLKKIPSPSHFLYLYICMEMGK